MMDTFKPHDAKLLSPDQNEGALESLIFLKEKCDGVIKGHECADGRKQQEMANTGDATSPTVSLEAILITSTIDDFEGRDIGS
jgi:hypothetical protein